MSDHPIASIKLNGYTTNFFPTKSGIKQGDSLSGVNMLNIYSVNDINATLPGKAVIVEIVNMSNVMTTYWHKKVYLCSILQTPGMSKLQIH